LKGLSLYSWNVNGIRASHKKGFLDWLNKASPDILCLQETKAEADQLPDDLRNPPGYHSYFFSSKTRRGYSGVAIYSKLKPNSITYGFGIPQFDQEGRTIIADYGDFLVFGVYFPNGQRSLERLDYKMQFYNAFLIHIEKLHAEGRHIIVCGDFNTAHKEIDLARPKANENISGFLPIERNWIDQLISSGYKDTFRSFNQAGNEYTWWNMRSFARERNVGWRLDYFFVNKEFMPNVTNASIHQNIFGSDHCPISLDISLKT
tara:strand:- start:266 stop:1048 length:783 start_codon:yes stop_codon:yes gene_type:complete